MPSRRVRSFWSKSRTPTQAQRGGLSRMYLLDTNVSELLTVVTRNVAGFKPFKVRVLNPFKPA